MNRYQKFAAQHLPKGYEIIQFHIQYRKLYLQYSFKQSTLFVTQEDQI